MTALDTPSRPRRSEAHLTALGPLAAESLSQRYRLGFISVRLFRPSHLPFGSVANDFLGGSNRRKAFTPSSRRRCDFSRSSSS